MMIASSGPRAAKAPPEAGSSCHVIKVGGCCASRLPGHRLVPRPPHLACILLGVQRVLQNQARQPPRVHRLAGVGQLRGQAHTQLCILLLLQAVQRLLRLVANCGVRRLGGLEEGRQLHVAVIPDASRPYSITGRRWGALETLCSRVGTADDVSTAISLRQASPRQSEAGRNGLGPPTACFGCPGFPMALATRHAFQSRRAAIEARSQRLCLQPHSSLL